MPTTKKAKRPKTPPRKAGSEDSRLTREEWLRRALDVLAAHGPGSLNIQRLVDALGVSRGSFYWHFTDRADFVHALLDYWHDKYTAPVPDLIGSKGGTGREKFLVFIRAIHEKDLVRFDMPIRSWAMQEPEVAERLMRTDRFRLEFTISLFVEMGFSASQANLRARACVAYLIMGEHLLEGPSTIVDAGQVEEIAEFFCD
jgi:AcrR family transcriptional regulator